MIGCGGGETTGTPGSGGEWNPIIDVAAGYYCLEFEMENPDPNWEVDAFFQPDIDCDPNTPPIEPEFYGDHHYVWLCSTQICREGPAPQRQSLSIRWKFSTGAVKGSARPPVLQTRTINFIRAIPPSTEAETLDPANATVFFLPLVPVATKAEFRTQYESGEIVPPDFPTAYEAVVRLSGTSIYDDKLSVTFSVPLFIGDWDYCECVL